MNQLNRHIRIFISSTFRDMQTERELLVKEVFPRVRTFARTRQVEVTDIDLRWGITEEQAQTGQTIKICLEEIYKCMESPLFFIGLLGNRYGWVPKRFTDDIKRSLSEDIRFKHLLEEYPLGSTSITEMEVLFGVLKNSNLNQTTFFYHRDEELSKWVVEEIKAKVPEFDEQIQYRYKQQQLISKIRQSKEVVSRDYSRFEEFISIVEQDLRNEIDRLFPENAVPSEVDKKRLTHEAFAQPRKKIYIKDEKLYRQIEDAVNSEATYVLIAGESGLGKSSLVANYADELRAKNANCFIIEHYVGGGGEDSSDCKCIMTRVVQEINVKVDPEYYSKDRESIDLIEGNDKRAIPSDIDKLTNIFIERIDDISQICSTYIFLDALNQISDEYGKKLYWLPSNLPKNVKIIATSTAEKEIEEAILKKNNSQIISHPYLDKAKRHELIGAYLEKHGKQLNDEQMERVLSSGNTNNSLYLRTFLDEIRMFGVYDELDDNIKKLLSTETIDDLFEKIIERCETDYDWDRKGYVADVFKLLYVSRGGLRETELLEMLNEVIGKDVTRIELSSLLIGIDSHLLVRDGDIGFCHPYLGRAILDRYFGVEEKIEVKRQREIIIQYFREKLDVLYHGEYKDIKKIARELPYQYYQLGDKRGLFETYSDTKVLESLLEDEQKEYLDMTTYFEYLRADDVGHGWELVKKVGLKNERYDARFNALLSDKLAEFLNIQNATNEAMELLESALEIREGLYKENPANCAENYTTSLNSLACTYGYLNRDKEAIELFEKALAIRELLYKGNPTKYAEDYTISLNNLACTYKKINRHRDAIELEEKALAIREILYKESATTWAEHYTTGIYNLASTYKMINRHRESMELEEKSLAILEFLYRINPTKWANNYVGGLNNLAITYYALNRNEEALELFEKAHAIKEVLYRENPQRWIGNYTASLNNLAITYKDMARHREAIELFEKALEIREVLYEAYPEKWVEDYSRNLINLAESYKMLNRGEEAMVLEEKALKIIEVLYKERPERWVGYYTLSLNNLACTYVAISSYQNAAELIEKALVILEELYKADPERWVEDYSRNLINLAYSYKRLNRDEEAMVLEEKALNMIEVLYKEGSERWASQYVLCLSNLACTYGDIERHKEAIELEKRALEISEELYKKSPNRWRDDYTISIKNLAYTYKKLNHHEEASKLLDKIEKDDVSDSVTQELTGQRFCTRFAILSGLAVPIFLMLTIAASRILWQAGDAPNWVPVTGLALSCLTFLYFGIETARRRLSHLKTLSVQVPLLFIAMVVILALVGSINVNAFVGAVIIVGFLTFVEIASFWLARTFLKRYNNPR